MGRILLYCVTVFLSAFLLFQVQPVIGKFILPWFGSTPGVWTTCMLFFQVLLLGGYAYAHLLVSRLPAKRQAVLHGSLLLLALLALPITPSESLKPESGEGPVAGILLVLAVSVGFPYLLLSSTGPLLQGWFARLHPGRSPYRLYALSNVGSLLALVSYPFYVEREWTLNEQTFLWSLGFGLFVVITGACAWTLFRGRVASAPRSDAEAVFGETASFEAGGERSGNGTDSVWADAPLWFVLSATGSALLLATTNQMCLDIAVIPFLWVAPLAIYLFSFILTFDHSRWYARPLFVGLLPLGLWCAYSLLNHGVHADIAEQIVGYGVALFLGCMCCHGELARSKPAPQHLTFFFLVVSFGGAVGGLLVALVAPYVFDDFFEYPLLLAITPAVVLAAVFRNVIRIPSPPRARWRVVVGVIATSLALLAVLHVARGMLEPKNWLSAKDLKDQDKVDLATAWFDSVRAWLWVPPVLLLALVELRRHQDKRSFASWWGSLRLNAGIAAAFVGCLGLVAMIGACGWFMRKPEARVVARDRNFYGALAVKEYGIGKTWHDWTLRHGRIVHGFQLQKHLTWPTSYYGPETGVGLAVRFHQERWTPGRSFRIGVVGLGTGTLAAYANARIDPVVKSDWDYAKEERRDPGDVVRYYEINPMVVQWAWEHFSFLSDAKRRGADVDVFLGDARLVMQRQLENGEAQKFDVLAIDAFSSDAIPIHLLTKESCEVYWGHLKADGALAIHVTNRFIELKPVVVALAQALGKTLIYVENFADSPHGVDSSDWLVMTENEAILDELRSVQTDETKLPEAGTLWTDDYSSVWDLVKTQAVKDKSTEEDKGKPAVRKDGLWRRLFMRVHLAKTTELPKNEDG